MANFWHNLQLSGIAISVAVLGGVIQALTNFHPTDQITQLVMTTVGGIIIGLLNALLHKLQGTTVASVDNVVTPPKV